MKHLMSQHKTSICQFIKQQKKQWIIFVLFFEELASFSLYHDSSHVGVIAFV